MRSRVPLLVAVCAVSVLAVPLTAYAGIPFFGPIIPASFSTCAAGWGMLITVVNNVISFLLTLAIVFIAPLMVAYAGFLFVVNPVNSGGIQHAKDILTHTIVGIVIALAGWMIVDAIMVVLYNPGASSGTTRLGAWADLITSGNQPACLPQAGIAPRPGVITAPPTVAVVPGCPAPLTPLTDPLALQMEGGQTVLWPTDTRLQTCVNKFISKVGGTVTSAYRPQSYQTHLYEIRDRWCVQALKTNTAAACSSLKTTISTEVTKHFGSSWACGAVAQSASTHGLGTGVDISGIAHGSATVLQAADQSCLSWPNYTNDAVHYNLKSSCSCN